MDERARHLVATLDLIPHPEGGFLREFFRSGHMVSRDSGAPALSALTAIYYLLASGQHSRWHAIASDEQWTFLEGSPMELFMVGPPGGRPTSTRLGPVTEGCEPLAVVPAGSWQAARPTGAFALMSCTVAPGFEYADFRFLADDAQARQRVTPGLGELRDLL